MMQQKLIKKILHVEGMSCRSCELRIESTLKNIEGIIEVKASFGESRIYLTYEDNIVQLNNIIRLIKELDYDIKGEWSGESVFQREGKGKIRRNELQVTRLLGMGVVFFAIYILIKHSIGFNFIPEINQSMGYGILFIVGALTSLHCIAMCGGINLSQSVAYKTADNGDGMISRLRPSILYNAGRVTSYTIIGGIVGGLGSVVSLSGAAKGSVAIISGIFMIIMGINMLNIFPFLKRLTPGIPKMLGSKVYNNKRNYGPYYVGLLNGLMPCGPLQAMQLYALGTGSIAAGAASMFFFSLGTFPLTFGFGAITSVMSGRFTKKMLKGSAVLIIILGVIMLDRGLNLSGISIGSSLSSSPSGSISKKMDNIQVVTTVLESGRYAPITVEKGVPVRWIIKAEESDLNGCNNPLTIPGYNITKKLVPGDNIIEFTPVEEGIIPYTCWMGMIKSNIKVIGDINEVPDNQTE